MPSLEFQTITKSNIYADKNCKSYLNSFYMSSGTKVFFCNIFSW